MSLILNIETATSVCSVGLSDGGKLLSVRESHEKNTHAAKVTLFSEEVIQEAGLSLDQLRAVAVSMGPGSYTGLRIGVSAAKGFCYALGIPLISIPTLQSMALGAVHFLDHNVDNDKRVLLCPMIDARRMEVYTALYDLKNREVMKTAALVIDDNSFREELQSHHIYYFGDGADKCRDVLDKNKLTYIDGVKPSSRYMMDLSWKKFQDKKFEDVAYFEPYYLKDFIAGKPRVKGLE